MPQYANNSKRKPRATSSVSDMGHGYLGTNLFVHIVSRDGHAEERRQFLEAVESGTIQAQLEPLILHELSYALPRFAKQLNRDDVASYLISIVEWPGVLADKPVLIDTVHRWRQTPGLGFADAYLASLAARDDSPIFVLRARSFPIGCPNHRPLEDLPRRAFLAGDRAIRRAHKTALDA
jgi:predicted nucleic acid-binding protein